MLAEKFLVTGIDHVIFIDANEYPENITDFGRYNHDCRSNELVFQLSGSVNIRFHGKKLHQEANLIRFIPKGYYSEYLVERLEHGECIDIYFSTDIPISPESFVQTVEDSQRVRALFQKIFTVWSGKREGYYFQAMALLYEIIAAMQQQRYVPDRLRQLLEPALAAIAEQTGELSVPELAKKCGISESYLNRLFLQCFGLPPKRYITRRRMELAMELLRTGRFSVGHIAQRLGYENVYHFSRAFKETTGLAPTAYQKKCHSSK